MIFLTGFTYFQSILPIVLLYCCAYFMCRNIRAKREEMAGLKSPNKPVADWD